MTTLQRRIKNLWELSNFKITEFDNKLVITKKEDQLVVDFPEKPRMAQIIKRKNSKDIINDVLNEN